MKNKMWSVANTSINWGQHKADVFTKLKLQYGESRADKFMKAYEDRYDKYGRALLYWKLAFWLYDDYKYVERVGTRWYACVGTGGVGKTTLMKNIMYWFDPKLELDCVNLTLSDYVRKLQSMPTVNAMRALFMDEPDESFSPTSKMGREFRDILGKMRQQKLFTGICATTLTDIPNYIFKKLDSIIFLPTLGSGFIYKNIPQFKQYPIQQIREDYSKQGYQVFFDLQKSVGCLMFTTYNISPFTKEQEDSYLKSKADDYHSSMGQFLKNYSGNDEIKASEAKTAESEGSNVNYIANLVRKWAERDLNVTQISARTHLTKAKVMKVARENSIYINDYVFNQKSENVPI